MSDGGIKKNRLKLGATGSSSRGTPVGSRAGSPIPGSGRFLDTLTVQI